MTIKRLPGNTQKTKWSQKKNSTANWEKSSIKILSETWMISQKKCCEVHNQFSSAQGSAIQIFWLSQKSPTVDWEQDGQEEENSSSVKRYETQHQLFEIFLGRKKFHPEQEDELPKWLLDLSTRFWHVYHHAYKISHVSDGVGGREQQGGHAPFLRGESESKQRHQRVADDYEILDEQGGFWKKIRIPAGIFGASS